MADLKFEQKRSLTRREAADQLTALAAALREGEDAELELGSATLSLRIPDDLRSEIEVEIGDGEIELELEFKWPTTPTRTTPTRTTSTRTASTRTAPSRTAPSRTASGAATSTKRKNQPAKPARGGTTTTSGSTTGKRTAKT
ncbi:amphi-Trp domain-containing protein [Streptomyces venetus]|uniref:amphi-Trp domain-containing protein n=1 Tax=Streptomyces venetus TaxID=1701086 RepID=UPI003C2F53A6